MTEIQKAKKEFENIFKTPHALTSDDLANIHNLITALESANREMYEALEGCCECSNCYNRKCATNEIIDKYKED